jgi:hypothetical protein
MGLENRNLGFIDSISEGTARQKSSGFKFKALKNSFFNADPLSQALKHL